MKKEVITRRHFIKKSAALTMGLYLGKNSRWSFENSKESDSKSSVIVVKSDKVRNRRGIIDQKIVDQMLDLLIRNYTGAGDSKKAWLEFFSPGDVVGVKMNVMMTATRPELIMAIVTNLKSIGIADKQIIVWDRDDAGYGVEGVYKRKIKFGYDKNKISKIITEHCTALINVPGTKTHWLSGIAVAVKNWVGAVTDINVPDIGVSFRIHRDSCADVGMINALPAIRKKCRLVIVDAIRPLFHGGPQVNPGYLWYNNEIMMSTDPVAVDSVCLDLIQRKRMRYAGRRWPLYPPPKHILIADKKYNLGVSDLKRIEIKRFKI